jgi:hypothetical protein
MQILTQDKNLSSNIQITWQTQETWVWKWGGEKKGGVARVGRTVKVATDVSD